MKVIADLNDDLAEAFEEDREAGTPFETSKAAHIRRAVQLWNELENPEETLREKLDG